MKTKLFLFLSFLPILTFSQIDTVFYVDTFKYFLFEDNSLKNKYFEIYHSFDDNYLPTSGSKYLFDDSLQNFFLAYKIRIVPFDFVKDYYDYYSNPIILKSLSDTIEYFVFDSLQNKWILSDFYDIDSTEKYGIFWKEYFTKKWDFSLQSFVSGNKYKLFLDDNGNFLKRLYWNWQNDTFVFTQKHTYETLENGLILKDTAFVWSENYWKPQVLYLYDYDQNSNLILFEQKNFNSDSGYFVNYYKKINFYNQNLLTASYYLNFSEGWDTVARYLYEYDTLQRRTLALYQSYQNGWQNVYKTEFSYNSNGHLENYYTYSWTDSVWSYQNRVNYYYDGELLIEYVQQNFDSQSDSWVNLNKAIFEYNSLNLMTLNELFVWDSQDGYWKPNYMTTWDFIYGNKLIAKKSYMYDENSNVLIETSREQYSWKMALVANETSQNENIICFPNPFKNVLNIYGYKFNRIDIYNLNGQLITTVFTEQNQIDLSFLQSGVYFLKLYDGKKSETIKVIKN